MTDTTLNPSVDRVAPNSSEAEEAVLGSVLINPECYDDISFLEASDFFIVRNGWIWQVIVDIMTRGDAVDNLTVIQALEDAKKLETIGGSAYITRLINSTPTHIHAETYARIVERASVRRKVLTAAGDMATLALDSTAETSTVVDQAQRSLEVIALRRTQSYLSSGYEIVSDAMEQFLAWTSEPAQIRGFRSGIPMLDRVVGGFIPGSRPYTFYGATGMGKTRLLAYIALVLMEQAPGIIFSTETDPLRWVHRVVATFIDVPLKQLMAGDLTKFQQAEAIKIYERFHRLAGQYHMLRVSDPSPAEIRANCRKLMRQESCEWALIDSVHNVVSPGVTDVYTKTSLAAACTMSLGIDTGLAVLQTSQIGRNIKNRVGSLMPRLEDAKGSGDVEQGSAVVIGVYRHDYYVKRRLAKQGDFPSGNTTLVMLKNDQGDEGGWVPLQYIQGQYEYDERMQLSSGDADVPEMTEKASIDLEGF
jgi:replicative DNA helicase